MSDRPSSIWSRESSPPVSHPGERVECFADDCVLFSAMSSAWRGVGCLVLGCFVAGVARSQNAESPQKAATESSNELKAGDQQIEGATVERLVPQTLLGLIHAAEVQQEIGLSESQITQLEGFFQEIDGRWFRSRLLPAAKQFEVVAELEQRLIAWFAKHGSKDQLKRLRQLEARAQGTRMLLRPKLCQSLEIDSEQQRRLLELVKRTDQAGRAWQSAVTSGEATEALQQEFVEANQAEQQALSTVMRREQLQRLQSWLGPPFDTTKLQRIYPLAPELVEVEHWVNSTPLTLEQLRGKVVLLHFYAFQCHNCHANFEHYIRWHENYKDEDVVVIGIQTPETTRERDPEAVRNAAQEHGLEFPILIDLESKNWLTWGNTMWPTVYVIDQQGYLRHWWQGELNWEGNTADEAIESLVESLLAS